MEHILDEVLKEKRSQLFETGGIDIELPYIKPAIVIGLGGSGVKTVARLKKRMDTWAESFAKTYSVNRKSETMPAEEIEFTVRNALRDFTEYLTIDTISFLNLPQEDKEIEGVLGVDDYLYAGGFNPVTYISRQYVGDENLQRWWDNDFHPPFAWIDDGARRFRMLGRLALYRVKEDFHNKLTKKIAKVVSLRKDLVNLGLIHATEEHLNEILVYIVSGSNGGTGSGMLFDIVFHAFSAVREAGDLLPKIRIVVISPRIYLMKAIQSGSGLNNALSANAYAFFQSLAFISERPTEAIKYVFDYNENPMLKSLSEDDFSGDWRPDKIYVVDTEIKGKEVDNLDDLLTNAADYLFLDITQPVAIGGSQIVNFENVLDSYFKGHRQILASFGISYFLLPSLTIIKGLTALLLHDVLGYILRKSNETKNELLEKSSGVSDRIVDEGLKIGKKVIESVVSTGVEDYNELERWLITYENKPSELKQVLNLWNEHKETSEDASKIGFVTNSLQKKQKENEEKLSILKSLYWKKLWIVGGICSLLGAAVGWSIAIETEFMPPLLGGLAGAALVGSLGFIITQLLTKDQLHNYQNCERDLSDINKKIESYNKSVRDIEKLIESKLKESKEKIKENMGNVALLAKELRDSTSEYIGNKLFNIEPEELTTKRTTTYCWGYEKVDNKSSKELKPIIGPPSRDRGIQILRKLFSVQNTISTEKDNIGIDYLNFRENDNRQDYYANVIAILSAANYSGGRLSADEANRLLKELIIKTKDKVIRLYNENYGDIWSGLSLFKDVIKKMEKDFVSYGEKMETLSDPTWAYQKEDCEQPKKIEATHLVPKSMKDDFKSVWGAKVGEGSLYDKRLVITVQSEFGVPIFGLRGMREWQRKYKTWMSEWRARKEAPPHIDKRWLSDYAQTEKSKPLLPVLEPNDDDKIMEALLRLLLIGNYMSSLSAKSNGQDVKKLQSIRGESFPLFFDKYLELWREANNEDQMPKTEEPITPRKQAENLYSMLKVYFDKFKERVTKEEHKKDLGEIQSFWDLVKDKFIDFSVDQKDKTDTFKKLVSAVSRTYDASDEELKLLVSKLEGLFQVRNLSSATLTIEYDREFVSYLTLALARLQ